MGQRPPAGAGGYAVTKSRKTDEVYTGYDFGHEVVGFWYEDEWSAWPGAVRFKDTGDRVNSKTMRNRACPKCGEKRTKDGHDPCIGNLPGVLHACCGHGVEEGYVSFASGIVIRGNFAHLRPKDAEEKQTEKAAE